MDFTIFLQPQAKEYFKNLLQKNNDKNAFKLGFKVAGCNGYQYVLEMVNDNNTEQSLNKFNFGDITFLISNDDLPKLNNVIINYEKKGLNTLLHYDNPNISYECGCGESVNFK